MFELDPQASALSLRGTMTLLTEYSWFLPLVVVLIVAGLYLLWACFLDPLRNVPGPLAARVTPFWLTLQCRLFRRSTSIHELHQKYGDVVRIGPNNISVVSKGCLQQVYGSNSGTSKGPFYDVFRPQVPIIFSARDNFFHARRRKDLTPAFTKSALRGFEPYMSTQILNLKYALTRKVEAGGGVAFLNFAPWANYLAFDVIANFVFGESFGFIDAGYDFHNLISTIDLRMQCLNALGTVPGWARPLMKWMPFDGFWRQNLTTTMNLQALARTSTEARKQQSGVDRDDMLSFLIKAKQENGMPLPHESIIAEAASFVSGGSDSTSTTLTHFVDFVSRRPDAMRRLQDELDAAFSGTQPLDWVPSEEIVGNLPFLTALLKETMRLRPTSAAGLERITGKEMKIGEYVLPRGVLVSVPTYTLHRREDVFPNPDQFIPERWLAGDSAAMTASWAPFSYGTRSCLGKHFAWMELSKAVAMLFKEFDVVRASEAETVLQEGFFMKGSECNVILIKRGQMRQSGS
ncbi:cytochrome P450 [Hypoxylon rubiginosum]|uniref:Cytochrome P450 n=1 Tax=Hypoxylon rubiginosum TaxID=110542 RepID=A0ACC0CMC2_9PEZI|nr:cytochrome P450 [Hypoxylon rubiginosum]